MPFPEKIKVRRQYFEFFYKFLGIIGRKRLGQLFWIMIRLYYYLVNGIRLRLGLLLLDPKNINFSANNIGVWFLTLTFGFSHTKHSLG